LGEVAAGGGTEYSAIGVPAADEDAKASETRASKAIDSANLLTPFSIARS
jgi:hypothetical protein